MAEQKELKKPGADQAGSIVAPCQKTFDFTRQD